MSDEERAALADHCFGLADLIERFALSLIPSDSEETYK